MDEPAPLANGMLRGDEPAHVASSPRRSRALRLASLGCWLGFAVAGALGCLGLALVLGYAESAEEQATGWATVEGVITLVFAVVVGVTSLLLLQLARRSPVGTGAFFAAAGALLVLSATQALVGDDSLLAPLSAWFLMSLGAVMSVLGAAVIRLAR